MCNDEGLNDLRDLYVAYKSYQDEIDQDLVKLETLSNEFKDIVKRIESKMCTCDAQKKKLLLLLDYMCSVVKTHNNLK